MIARAGVGLLLAVLGLVALALGAGESPVTVDLIALESYRDGNGEIYLLDTVTGILHNLTHHSKTDSRPAWSPDGRRIAFYTNRTDNYEIFVMDASGANARNLTRNNSDDVQPAWSPDGQRIAFVSRRNGNSELYIMEVARILDDPACALLPNTLLLNESQPCAAPVERLTNSAVDEISPAWSPDGRRIVFVQETDRDSEIFLMNAGCDLPDGCESDRYNLSDNPAHDRDPAWSPDGRLIAFASNRTGAWQIYAMNADGSRVRPLTDGAMTAVMPAWSPDGQRIAFAGRQAGAWALYVVDADGSNLRRLTYNRTEDFRPVWRP